MTERTLFLAWQDPNTRSWFPVGRLRQRPQGGFAFAYTKGARAAREAGFDYINGFDSFEKVYESDELFPLFANRLMRASRPDYPEYIQRLKVAEDADEMAVLARSGGRRLTDAFEVFPLPLPDEKGRYHVHFFAHGIRHLTSEAQNAAEKLQANNPLFLMRDSQNPKDADAWTNLGVAAGEQGRLEEAIAHFTTALEMDQNHAMAREALEYARTVVPPH